VIALVSAFFIVPWLNTPVDDHDQSLRARLAGQIDTLIIGQSYAMDGIIPAKLDEKLGTVTYNLSGSLMPVYGQKYMVEKELARNPIQHVLIEITPDTFTTDQLSTYGNGDSYIVARLDSFAERLNYMVRCVQPSDWPNIYARMLLLSMRFTVNQLLGNVDLIDDTNMGFNPQRAQDVSGDQSWAQAAYQSSSVFGNPIEANIQQYEDLIQMCLDAGCDVTLVYTPVCHAKIWQLYDQDTFLDWANALAEKYDIPVFDFNLFSSRYDLFNDYTSFSDDNHLSEEGACVFSELMADILLRYRNGEDVSHYFYPNYWATIQDSVYWYK
jgi:hypothetical protein